MQNLKTSILESSNQLERGYENNNIDDNNLYTEASDKDDSPSNKNNNFCIFKNKHQQNNYNQFFEFLG